MNINATTVRIRTPWNRPNIRSTPETRRVLVNGRWLKQDPQAATVYAWLKGAN